MECVQCLRECCRYGCGKTVAVFRFGMIYDRPNNNLNDLPWTSMDHVQGNNDSLQFKEFR